MKKFGILITDTALLYPPLWGGPKRIWNLYSNLSEDLFDITYVGSNFFSENGLNYRVIRIRDNFREILARPAPHYYYWHALERLVFKNCSLDLFVYLLMDTDWQFKYILDSQGADIIICSHPWSSPCVHKNDKQLFIYDAHNCEYLLMDRILGKHIFKKFVLKRVKQIEEDACKKSDLILACSEKEKRDLIDLYKIDADKIITIPNGANINAKKHLQDKAYLRKWLSVEEKEKVIIFVGTFYKPNIDAARFIIERIAPLLGGFKFLIAGTVSDFFKGKALPRNAILLGKLDEWQLDNAMNASDIAINPMFDGSGMNIKMLDYMSYGLPIVSTECGARGIETDGLEPMIVSSIDKFAENIKMLDADKILYKRISEAGRSLVSRHYDWKMLSNKLEVAIIERLKNKRA